MVRKFYAVTETSVYEVKYRRSKNDPYPVAKKIAVKGESEIGVGEELKNGTMLAITAQLQMYIPEGGGITSHQRRIEDVNTRWWGGHSSNIVALFFTKKKAMSCFSESSRRTCDTKWLSSTVEVLQKIGDEHPSFYVCRFRGLSLVDRAAEYTL